VSSSVLVIIGVLALYTWVLSPHIGYLHAMQQLESAVDRVTEERERICSDRDTKIQRWRTLQRQMAEADEELFSADQAQTFVRGLLPWVEETGCAVVLADFPGDRKAAPAEDPNVPVSIAVSHLNLDAGGQPDQVRALLQRLEQRRPRVWIDSCRFEFSDGYSGRMSCSLVLTIYVVANR